MEKPRLLDQVRSLMRLKHLSLRTEEAYINWIKRFIFFHHKRHPCEMGAAEITAFLSHLAEVERVGALTQNQAFSALLFLYREVLGRDFPQLSEVVRAKRPQNVPVVLTRSEIKRVLAELRGTHHLMANLLYGAGLRLMECVRLRVKDISFEQRQLIITDGKGGKSRVTMLPQAVEEPLGRHLAQVEAQYKIDLRHGGGSVYVPEALARKYPNAHRNGAGSMCFRRRVPRSTRVQVQNAVITYQRICCNARSKRRSSAPELTVWRAVTRCATRLPRICWSMAMTSERCRNSWDTKTCARR